ncbi:uncharacterized protein LOC141812196 isoform X2 [Curcuma longa]|uniref:uncharacterized protein LOC141812196 isoform X2 n=1 Tax=Curcuma longa TaxID=136217 RepID=UPI003D9EF658
MASAPPFPSPLLPWSPLHSPFALSAAGLTIQRPSSVSRRHLTVFPIRALKEWSEYEEALREKDLARALRYLKSEAATDPIRPPEDSSVVSVAYAPPDYSRPERDWEVLDACLNADDMRLVGSAYAFLQDRGFLPNFGKFGNIVLEGPREVTPTVLTESTGLEASKLAPQKWGLSGSSRLLLVGCFGGFSLLLSKGIDIRPNLAAILVLGMLDAIFLGGSAFAQVQCFWPPYKRRVLVHEAGHLLTGTQFWDEKLDNEHAEGRLSSTAFDRYCMVLFAGIAAEALVYGEAEGGENDENLFRSLCVLLRPPLSVSEMSNRARWSVMQSYNLLKQHKNAHKAAVKALENGHSLGVIIRRIEEAMSSSN